MTPAVLRLPAAKVMETCDAIDGVRDGILENPEACTFKLASLPACASDVTTEGYVTRAQHAALTAFTPPLTASTLRDPGWPFGDEADPQGWGTWIAWPVADVMEQVARTAPTLQEEIGIEFSKYFVYGDSARRYVDSAGIVRRSVGQAEAPSRVIARKLGGTEVVRTPPLCACPMTARYNGTGSADHAAAFACRQAISSSRGAPGSMESLRRIA